MPDYQTMTSVEAIRYAKELSGLTAEEAASRAGVSAVVMRRYLRTDDDSSPGLDLSPALCRAFGNPAILVWLAAQAEQGSVDIPQAQSRADVLTAVARAAASLGDVQRCLADSENSGVTPAVAREVRSLLLEVEADTRRAYLMLHEQAQHKNPRAVPPLASLAAVAKPSCLQKILRKLKDWK
jgi:transcriptional regulator with XRE-family HTH domain